MHSLNKVLSVTILVCVFFVAVSKADTTSITKVDNEAPVSDSTAKKDTPVTNDNVTDTAVVGDSKHDSTVSTAEPESNTDSDDEVSVSDSTAKEDTTVTDDSVTDTVAVEDSKPESTDTSAKKKSKRKSTSSKAGTKGHVGFDNGLSISSSSTNADTIITIVGVSDTFNMKNSTRTSTFSILPRFSVIANEISEITFSFDIKFTRNVVTTEVDNDDFVTSTLATKVGFGIGYFAHVIRTEHVHFSIGPKMSMCFGGAPKVEFTDSDGNDETVDNDSLYSKYVASEFYLALPLNCDIHFTDNFGMRIYAYTFGLFVNSVKIKPEGVSTETKTSDVEFKILNSLFTPSLGIFWRF